MPGGPKPKDKPTPTSCDRPKPGRDLDAAGKAAFTSLCNDLTKQGTLHGTDAKLITLYAKTYSLFARAEAQLANEDLTLVAANGRSFINPLANVINNTTSRLHSILNDLGLSPRTRVLVDTDEADAKWSTLDA